MRRAGRLIAAWWLLLMGIAIIITEVMMAWGYPLLDGFNPLSWVAVLLTYTYPLPMILIAVVGIVIGIVLLCRPPKDQ